MSRVEKHRKYREEAAASISSNQKSVESIKQDTAGPFNSGSTGGFKKAEPEKIEAIDFSKPIRRLNESKVINRGNREDTPFQVKGPVKPNINIDELRERSRTHSENELFDIDTAFNQLKKEHASPEMDTQLEVMNNLFSDNLTEYNSTMQLQTPAVSNRQVVIDESKLMSLLDEREQRLKTELLTKEKEQQSRVMLEQEKARKAQEKIAKAEQVRIEKDQAKFEKEQAKFANVPAVQPNGMAVVPNQQDIAQQLIKPPQTMAPKNSGITRNTLAEVNEKWAEETQNLQTRVKQHDYEFVNLEKNLRKNNVIILILIFILLGIFGYLVYTFITA